MNPLHADPNHVGIELKRLRENFPNKPLSELADMLKWDQFPPMKSDTSCSETIAQYQNELKIRADQGDKFALSILNGKGPLEGPVNE